MFDIELKNITKTYVGNDVPAVTNLNLTVEKGSIVTLLGPSGCGKSTTLRLIAGFERADEGTISLGGKVVSDAKTWISPEKRGVGMVFQDYALFPHLTVYNNIGFGYKGKDRHNRIMEVISLVNLQGFEKRYPFELSGGQQQRVALARALTRRPVVVLLDEPFSNLDADLRIHMRLEVKRIIKEAGTTAIFVSHDQKDALSISDKIVVMNQGIVHQHGTPKEIYNKPANKFVATFVGQSNILTGTICENGCSILTDIGIISCDPSHDLKPGDDAYISIRPDSIKKDTDGNIEGIIKHYEFAGDSIDAVALVKLKNGTTQELVIHVTPDEELTVGSKINFKITPNFVSIVKK